MDGSYGKGKATVYGSSRLEMYWHIESQPDSRTHRHGVADLACSSCRVYLGRTKEDVDQPASRSLGVTGSVGRSTAKSNRVCLIGKLLQCVDICSKL